MRDSSTGVPPPPTRFCDVVMKGGVTSGVVFPLALVELSRHYRLRNIGGTSAGAIAAAAAAAAELGRGRDQAGFERLAALPKLLATRSDETGRNQLFGFFQPQPRTKPLFDLATAWLEKGVVSKLRAAAAILKATPGWTLGGAFPGLACGWLAWTRPSSFVNLLSIAAAVVLLLCAWPLIRAAAHARPKLTGLGLVLVALVGGFAPQLIIPLSVTAVGTILFTVIGLVLFAAKRLPENCYGLCTGMDVPGGPRTQPPLTVWLTAYLNELAGRDPAGPPLTFGDLSQERDGIASPVVNLEMMTTCLTHGRPYRLPFRDDDILKENGQFFFRPDEFKRFFPAHVVQWMIDHPRPLSDRGSAEERERRIARGYHPMPAPPDLPVVVATRMSLSFPILLSAVPLHAYDFSLKGAKERDPERCWFSDGGISSNFPVHLFDSALPRWPTFAITLTEKHPERPAVFLPKTNSTGFDERWTRFDQVGGVAALAGLLVAIFNAARNWSDNSLARLPGFRDRIADIGLTPKEGGLNLNMEGPLIETLSGYGKEAGAAFAAHFGHNPPPGVTLTWANHRRVRLLTTLAALEELLSKLERNAESPLEPDTLYEVGPLHDDTSYEWKRAEQREHAVAVFGLLRLLGKKLNDGTAHQKIAAVAPRPRPELRVRPRI